MEGKYGRSDGDRFGYSANARNKACPIKFAFSSRSASRVFEVDLIARPAEFSLSIFFTRMV